MKKINNESKESARDSLSDNVKNFKIFLIIISILNAITNLFYAWFSNWDIPVFILVILFLSLGALTYWKFKNVDVDNCIELKNSFLSIGLLSLFILSYLLFYGLFPGITILLTFYSFKLRRSVIRYERGLFGKKEFVDRVFSFLEVLIVFIFTIGSILTYISRQIPV